MPDIEKLKTQLRDETYHEAKHLLKKYKRCVIIRPTGFGKTGILTRFIKKYKRVIYLYPANVVMDTVLSFYYNGNIPPEKTIPNVEFMSYKRLTMLTEEQMESYSDVDLIIADECHRLGAFNTVDAIKRLLAMLPDVHMLGATATPERMDLVDEISMFFQNHVVSRYTLHDAFQDGILKRPYYCFCSYAVEDDINDTQAQADTEINKIASDEDRNTAKELLRARLIEISDIAQMDNIIRETCDEYAADTSYMKGIVFFSSHKHLHDKLPDVTEWLQSAYPNHTINTLIVSSEKHEYSQNVEKLPELTNRPNTIDVIACCDMMNLGYHVSDLTFIAMYRGTVSGIIYTQQLGRALSSGTDNACIVFDIVDNIHREALYDVLGHKSKNTVKRKKRLKELEDKLASNITENTEPLSEQEELELKALHRVFNQDKHWWVRANDLEPEDLIATGHEATYRDLIAKTVAEPISMRCRQAYAYWKERGGDDSTFTPEYVMSRQSPNAVPLSPFAKVKKVSVEAVLNEIFGPNDYHELIEKYGH